MARPSKYSEAIADEICAGIATSTKGLDHLCDENATWPDSAQIYRWLIKREEFREKYARAREQQQQLLADQLIPLADTDRICEKRTTKPDGSVETVVLDMVERSKLQIETRKWLLGKLNPKTYGDKTAHTGPDGEGPMELIVRHIGSNQ